MSPAHRPDQHPDVAHSPEPSAQSTTRPASPAGSSATATLVVTALLVLTQLYAAIPLLAPISADLHGNATVALSTAFSLTYAAGFLIWGPVSDHYGRRRTMALALGILTVSTGCCALAPSLPALAALRAIQGLSASGFAPVSLAYLSEALAPPRRAGAIGAMSTSFLVAGIVGQVLASLVALHLGWRWFFPLCGGLLAVALAAVLAVVHDAAHASGPSGSSLRGSSHRWDGLRSDLRFWRSAWRTSRYSWCLSPCTRGSAATSSRWACGLRRSFSSAWRPCRPCSSVSAPAGSPQGGPGRR